jgi:hypothetical protein
MSPTEATNTQEITRQYHDAYVATAAERAALAPSELLSVNLDIPLSVTTVIGAMKAMQPLHAEAAEKLPATILEHLDKADTYARALGHAQTVYLASSRPDEILPALAARALELRDVLVTDAKALARRGYLDSKPLADLKGGPGYLNIASDLGVLVQMLRDRWSTVASKTAIPEADLDEAEKIAAQINDAYSDRNRPNERVSATAEDRQRAFTLLVKSYDQVRRAATFLRWNQGDADKFTPSLWAGRGGRGSNTDASSKVDPTAPTEPGAPIAPTAHAPSAPQASVASPAGVGLPTSSPFAEN